MVDSESSVFHHNALNIAFINLQHFRLGSSEAIPTRQNNNCSLFSSTGRRLFCKTKLRKYIRCVRKVSLFILTKINYIQQCRLGPFNLFHFEDIFFPASPPLFNKSIKFSFGIIINCLDTFLLILSLVRSLRPNNDFSFLKSKQK